MSYCDYQTSTAYNPSTLSLPELRTKLREAELELSGAQSTWRQMAQDNRAAGQHEPELEELKAPIRALKCAIERRARDMRGAVYTWTDREYVENFEGGRMDYTHLEDKAAMEHLIRAFENAQPYNHPPPSDLIRLVATLVNSGLYATPLADHQYIQNRMRARKENAPKDPRFGRA